MNPSSSYDDEDSEELRVGCDGSLMRDKEGLRRLALMTEKEREQELFNRSECHETLKIKSEIEGKLRTKARRKDQERKQSKLVRAKNMINLVFATTVSAVCFIQCYSQIQEYLKFDLRLKVHHTVPTTPLWLLPGITICTNNRVRLSKLKIFHSPPNRTKNGNSIYESEVSKLDRLQRIKSIVDGKMNMTSLLNESPVSKLYELSKVSLVKDVNCNSVWARPFNCENIRIIDSFQGSSCQTLFYMGAKYEALASGALYDFNTSLLSGQPKLDQFDNYEMANIYIDYEAGEHADFSRDPGAKLLVHSSTQVGSISDMSYTILPGRNYEILIKRGVEIRLRHPFKSRCKDYIKYNMHHFIENEGSYPSIELDKITCVRNCILSNTLKSCGCWPIEAPFYPGDPILNNSGSFPFCLWGLTAQISESYFETYRKCYMTIQVDCKTKCNPSCWAEEHRIDVVSKPWPNNNLFFEARSKTELDELLRLKVCCSKVTLKYLGYGETRYIMYPNLSFAQLISNLGGIVSAMIGLSLISIYRYFTRQVFHLKVISDYSGIKSNSTRLRPVQIGLRSIHRLAETSRPK